MVLLGLMIVSCKSKSSIKNSEKVATAFQFLNMKEIQYVLQEGLHTNHLDEYFSDRDMTKNISILINDLIDPYVKKITLNKFEKKFTFKAINKFTKNLMRNL